MALPNKGDTYICEACKGEFVAEKERSDQITESELYFQREMPPEEECSTVCDDCWKKIKAFYDRVGINHPE